MWTDPYISKQLLELHINPEHDIASRGQEKIKKIVDWILEKANKPQLKILDLGCGPGLYAERFAQKGHSVTGIDFSANSIQYAIQQAKAEQLTIEYLNQDYLNLSFENQFDLVIMMYLDFCVLLPEERDLVLQKIHRSLKKGGVFICDIVNEKNIEKKILPQSWEVLSRGFWRDEPYVVLNGGFHYPESKVLVNQHVVIDSGEHFDRYIFWNHYYEQSELTDLLELHGFTTIKTFENVLTGDGPWTGENISFYLSRK